MSLVIFFIYGDFFVSVFSFVFVFVVADKLMDEEALRALENILSAGEENGGVYVRLVEGCAGFEKIEELQSHQNEEVAQMSRRISEKYWTVK
jgi:hypothetical protein